MIAHRFANNAAFVVLLLSLPACVPCEHPLVEPEKSKLDERFVGVWKHVEDDNETYFFIGRPSFAQKHLGLRNLAKDRPDGLMVMRRAAFHVGSSELEFSDQPTYFFSAKAGANTYMQLPVLDKNDKLTKWDTAKVKGYHLSKCELTDDRLIIYEMDIEGAAKAIEDGKLKGTVKGTAKLPLGDREVRITESTEGLNRYLAKDGLQALFPDASKISLVRVK